MPGNMDGKYPARRSRGPTVGRSICAGATYWHAGCSLEMPKAAAWSWLKAPWVRNDREPDRPPARPGTARVPAGSPARCPGAFCTAVRRSLRGGGTGQCHTRRLRDLQFPVVPVLMHIAVRIVERWKWTGSRNVWLTLTAIVIGACAYALAHRYLRAQAAAVREQLTGQYASRDTLV